MSKMHVQLATIETSITPLTIPDMNHIRGGMATMDAEKTKKVTQNSIRHGWDKDGDGVKDVKIKKIKD
jgi:hypothetical protein